VIGVSVLPVLARLFENSRASGGSELELGWTAYTPDTYTVATRTALPLAAATVVILGCAGLVRWRQRDGADQGQPVI